MHIRVRALFFCVFLQFSYKLVQKTMLLLIFSY